MKKQYIQAILEMLATGDTPEAVIAGLKKVLSGRGHESLFVPVLSGVLRVLESEVDRLAPAVKVAKETDLKKHEAAIRQALAAMGADEKYVVVEDETIIGGFIATVQNNVYDASYKTKLVNLYRNIAK